MRLVVRLGGGGLSGRVLLERERRLSRDERVVETLEVGDGDGGGSAAQVFMVVLMLQLHFRKFHSSTV